MGYTYKNFDMFKEMHDLPVGKYLACGYSVALSAACRCSVLVFLLIALLVLWNSNSAYWTVQPLWTDTFLCCLSSRTDKKAPAKETINCLPFWYV